MTREARLAVAAVAVERLRAVEPNWHPHVVEIDGGGAVSIIRIRIGRSPESFVWVTAAGLVRIGSGIAGLWRGKVRDALGELLDPDRGDRPRFHPAPAKRDDAYVPGESRSRWPR